MPRILLAAEIYAQSGRKILERLGITHLHLSVSYARRPLRDCNAVCVRGCLGACVAL
jgi:hypothetical protein